MTFDRKNFYGAIGWFVLDESCEMWGAQLRHETEVLSGLYEALSAREECNIDSDLFPGHIHIYIHFLWSGANQSQQIIEAHMSGKLLR